MSTTLCNYASGILQDSDFAGSCAWRDLATDDPWINYISEIGYTSAHALLALSGILSSFLSLIKTLRQYNRFTGFAALTNLSEFQILNICLHVGVILLGIAYLTGFALHVMASTPGWYIVSALCEILVYGIQFVLVVLNYRSWMHAFKFQCTSWAGLAFVFYVVLSVLYLALFCAYAAQLKTEAVVPVGGLRNATRAVFVCLQILRGIIAGITVTGGLRGLVVDSRSTYIEVEMLLATLSLSGLTIVTSTLSVLFTLDIFCPNRGAEEGDVWIHLYEWFYLVTWCILVLLCCFRSHSAAEDRAVHDIGPERGAALSSVENTSYNRQRSMSVVPGRASVYGAPRRPSQWLDQSSRRISSLPTPVTTPRHNRLDAIHVVQEQDDHWLRAITSRFTLADIVLIPSAVLLACLLVLILVLNVTWLTDTRTSLPTLLLTIYSVVIFCQIVMNAFGNVEIPFLLRSSMRRISLAVALIIATVVPFLVWKDFAYFFAYGLWPMGTLIVITTTGRTQEMDRVGRLLRRLGGSRKKIKRVHAENADERTSPTAPPNEWRLATQCALRWSMSLLVLAAFFTTVLNGMYLAVAASCIILGVGEISEAAKRVGNGIKCQLALWGIGVGVLIVVVVLAVIVPVYGINSSGGRTVDVIWNAESVIPGTSPIPDARARGVLVNYKQYDTSSAAGSMLQTVSGTVFFNSGAALANVKGLAEYICTTTSSLPPIVLIPTNLAALRNLLHLDLPAVSLSIGYKRDISAMSALDFSPSLGLDIMVYPFENVVANPLLVIAEQRRGHRVAALFTKQTEISAGFKFARQAGVDAVVVHNVGTAIAALGERQGGDAGARAPTTSTPTSPLRDASPKTRWAVAVATVPVVIISVGSLYLIVRLQMRKPHLERYPVFHKSILTHVTLMNKQTARIGATIADMVSLAGWCMFVIGGAEAAELSQISALTYIFGILGALSLSLSVVMTFNSTRWILPVSTCVSSTTALSAGHAAQAASYGTSSGEHLMLAGAVIYVACQVLRTFISRFRYSHTRMEAERSVLIVTIGTVFGWIILAVGIGRHQADLGKSLPLGLYGAAVATPLAAVTSILSSKQNGRHLNGAAGASGVLALVFLGAVIGDSTGASRTVHQNLMLSGSIICATCLTSALLIKGWEFDTLQSKALRQRLRQQICEVWSRGTSDVSLPLPPRTPVFFTSITQNSTMWSTWKIVAIIAIVGWIIAVGGFGAATGDLAKSDVLVAGIVFSCTAPTAIALATIALLRDSRRLAIVSGVVMVIGLASLGRFVDAAAQAVNDGTDELAASCCVIAGGFMFLVSATTLLCLMTHRLVLPPTASLGLSKQRGRKSVFSALLILWSSGWSAYIAGVGISVQLTIGLRAVAPILGAVLSALSLAAYLGARLLISNVLNPNTTTVRPDALQQIILSTILPTVITAGAVTQIGAAGFASSGHLAHCTNFACGSQSLIGDRSILAGTVILMIGLKVWISYAFLTGEMCKAETEEESERRWSGRYPRQQGHSEVMVSASTLAEPVRENKLSKPNEKPTERFADLHRVLLAWPHLQVIFKLGIATSSFAWAAFVVSFWRLRPSSNLGLFAGHFVFAISGVITIVMAVCWLIISRDRYYVIGLGTLVPSIAAAGYVFFWCIPEPTPSPSTGMLIASLLYSVPATALLAGVMMARKHEVHWPNRELRIRYPHLLFALSVVGWIVFAIGFWVLCNALGSLPESTGEAAANIVLLSCGVLYASLYLTHLRLDRRRIRTMLYALSAIVLWSATATFHFACVNVASQSSPSRTGEAAVAGGSMIIILSKVLLIILRVRPSGDLDLTQGEKDKLALDPSHHEESEHWIHFPSAADSKYLLRICVMVLGVSWLLYVIGLGIWKIPEPAATGEMFDIFAVVSVAVPILVILRIYAQWTTAGWLGTVSAVLALCTGGATCFATTLSSRSGGNIITLSGCIITLIATLTLIVILLHRGEVEIPPKRLFVYTARGIVLALGIGCVVFGAGFAKARGKITETTEGNLAGYLLTLVGVVTTAAIGLEVLNARLQATPAITERMRLWVVHLIERSRKMFSNLRYFKSWSRDAEPADIQNRSLARWQPEDSLVEKPDAAQDPGGNEQPSENIASAPQENAATNVQLAVPYPASRRLNVFLAAVGTILSGIPVFISRPLAAVNTTFTLQLIGSIILLVACAAYICLIEIVQTWEGSRPPTENQVQHPSADTLSSTSESPSATSRSSSESSSTTSLFLSRPSQTALNHAQLFGSRIFSSVNLLASRAAFSSELNLGLPIRPPMPRLGNRLSGSRGGLVGAQYSSKGMLRNTIFEDIGEGDLGSQERSEVRGLNTGRFRYKSEPYLHGRSPSDPVQGMPRLQIRTLKRGHRRTLSDSVSALTPQSEYAAIVAVRRLQHATDTGEVSQEEQSDTDHGNRRSVPGPREFPSSLDLVPIKPLLGRAYSSESLMSPRTESAIVDSIRRLQRNAGNIPVPLNSADSETSAFNDQQGLSRENEVVQGSSPKESDSAFPTPSAGWHSNSNTPASPRRRWLRNIEGVSQTNEIWEEDIE
ncbi:uncharacterized protein SPPG_01040 [Spizellomyces punctatus DAOM BR117]|uniref:Uncharacterized protein n=1 Tax=Spizellomyces punctatus (strain DAOM BR117) TaxID=645134 RepID=A0A0L0HRQ6_SPIPD|nr:uncharacterized protein SPPG_01040 [Spizellomyces punctatus DAOM BR117]KND03565.1 hypothetical protein SPPG_01040 [Spizellomyces punctatus DAOM BR117]|eukprot:XP_016611604.1 hypothetical protein SPPG_01040 [Spizellomyces punctatus DAOM BR117]